MKAQAKLLGYAPDIDPTTPGIFVNCAAIVPTLKGFKAAPSPIAMSLPALAAICQGAVVARKLDNTTRFLAATGTKIYEDATTSWTDRTRVSGGDYAAASDVRWSFAQFNDITLAAIKSDTLQYSSSGAFANVTGAPKATIVETVNEFVFLFDTNEAIYGDSPNRWWCAAQGNYTDWTPSVSTNCYTGTLLSSPGKIRAAKKFGDSIVVYKDRAMYIGYFAGSPVGWKFSQIPGESGALSNEVVVKVELAESPMHIFMGYSDFYAFDGSRPIPIGANIIKHTVFSELNRQYAHCSIALHDYDEDVIYFFYPTSSAKPDKCVVYNYRTRQWGRDDRTIEAAVEYIAAGSTYDGLGSSYSTYDDLPSASHDTAFAYSGSPLDVIFDANHTPKTLTGAAGNSSITLGDFGQDSDFTLLQRVKLRFITAPTSSTMVNYYRNNLSDALTMDATTSMSSGRYDVLREARWHRMRLDFVGDTEFSDVIIDAEISGSE